MKNRKNYTNEFKRNIIRMIIEDGKSQVAVAEEFGLHPNTIGKWIKSHKSIESTPQSEQELARELKELKKKLFDLEEENEILKKAATYFAKNQK